MAVWSRLQSLIFGGAIGAAASDAIAPQLEPAKQAAWLANQVRLLGPGDAARLVAQAKISLPEAVAEMARLGINANRANALVQLEQRAPTSSEAQSLRRRGRISRDQLLHAFAKEQIEPQYWDALAELVDERLSPQFVAAAVQRGVLVNAQDPASGETLLPVGAPVNVGRVPPMPVVPIDPITEAASSGYNFDRLAALTRIVGLPPGPQELLALLNRGEIELADYYRGIAEGNTRNEWAPFLLKLRRRILSPVDYVNLRLRAWIDTPTMHAGAALSGMTPEDADLLLLGHGRPISFHQVFIGLRRGGIYDGPVDALDPAFLKSLQESDIRPEWYNLAWSQRHTLPSAFVLRSLVESGNLTAAEGEQVLLHIGWPADLAHTVAQRWATGTGSTGHEQTKAELLDEYAGGWITEAELRSALAALGYSGTVLDREVHLADARRLKRWREKVVDTIAAAYIAHRVDDTAATSELAAAGVTGDAAAGLLYLWNLQRSYAIAELSPSQIARGYKHSLIARDAALAELEERGYTPIDAATLLDE